MNRTKTADTNKSTNSFLEPMENYCGDGEWRFREDIRYRLDFEQLIAEISGRLVNLKSSQVDSGINKSLEQIGSFVNVERAYIFSFHDNGTKSSNTHEWCAEGVRPQIENLQNLPNDSFPYATSTLLKGETLYCEDVSELGDEAKAEREEWTREGIQSLICIPMTAQERIVGFVGFDSVGEKRNWTADEQLLLKIVGQVFASAIERKQMEEALSRSESKYRYLVENAIEGILVTQDARIKFANPRIEEFSDYTIDELKSKPFLDFIHPEDREIAAENHRKRLNEKGVPHAYSIRIRKKSGKQVWLEVRGVRINWEGNPATLNFVHDITDRKKAEEALRTSEEKYRSIVQNTIDIIYSVSTDGIITFISPQVSRYGYTVNELVGRSVFEFIHPDDLQRVKSEFIKTKQTGEEFPTEFRIYGKDGKCFHIEENGKAITKDGEIVQITGVMRDITDRKQYEQRIREQLNFMGTLLDTIPNPVFYKDANGTYLGCNQAFLKLLGKTEKEVVGKTVYELGPEDIASEYYDKDRELFENPGTQVYEWRLKNSDGDIREVIFNKATFTNSDGEVLGLIGVILDVTERNKAMEEISKFKTISDKANYGTAIADPEGRLLYVNEYFAKLHGYAPEELTGNYLTMLCPEDKVSQLVELIEMLKSESDVQAQEIWRKRKDGTVFPSFTNMTLIKDEDSNPLYLGTTAVDISEKKNMEAELQKSDKLESLGLLAGGIAHDFNNILTAILGNITLARLELDPYHELQQALQSAEKASFEAQNLTRQLLTFSKGGAPIKETASISEIILETISFALRGSNTKCNFEIDDGLLSAEVDRGQLSQVIHNLVINADQAMPEGGSIDVIAQNTYINSNAGIPLREGMYIRISIKDKGVGISEKYLPKIFDPYFTTKQKGNGLGLASAYSIIKKHEGYIDVNSELNVGTEFIIYIPASEKQVETEEKADLHFEGNVDGRILVVDDEAIVRDMMKKLLGKLGFDAATVSDGESAIEMYRGEVEKGRKFDAVITDLTIPGAMGGLELVPHIKEIDPEAKILVSSGYSNDPAMAHHEQYGFCGVIPKPYNSQKLCQVLKSVLGESARAAT
ncbi:MAG: PAS domain S-box protein [candidate division Zixibacteria bacterium]|nr:PAS domain S-box protein [candidate division Zixibacteria bacterium]